MRDWAHSRRLGTPADEAGSVVLRQPPASKLANLFRIDVRDHALGLVRQFTVHLFRIFNSTRWHHFPSSLGALLAAREKLEPRNRIVPFEHCRYTWGMTRRACTAPTERLATTTPEPGGSPTDPRDIHERCSDTRHRHRSGEDGAGALVAGRAGRRL